MTKLVILGNGCIRERALELNFLKAISENGIERATSIEESNYILYITCAGVGDTIIKCLKSIRSLINCKQKDTKLIIVGCLTNVEGIFDGLNNRDDIKVITNLDWNVPVTNYMLEQNKELSSQIMLKNRTRYFFEHNVSLQFFLEKGCINNCSFCKINYASMPVESVPYDLALSYLKKQIQNGTKCINLNGENLTLYGLDLYGKQVLHTFIRELCLESGLVNLKVNELTASNMYPELLEELVNNPKIKGVTIQLESASDRLLTLMNRKHNLEEFDIIITKLKEKNKFITTVLMSGFPTETYEDMDKTINYVKDRGIFVNGLCQYVDFKYIPSSNSEQFSDREKRNHTFYLKKEIELNNYKILSDYISQMNSTVLAGKIDDYFVFEDAPMIIGVSKSKKYDNIDIGSMIEAKPNRLVHKSKFNNKMTYKY
jgi:tRNA A37 methylthiotransferase MiaB